MNPDPFVYMATATIDITKLHWPQRATRCGSGSREWWTSCGRYMVHCSEECYGVKLKPKYAAYVIQPNSCVYKLSDHREKHTAIAACEAHAKKMRESS